MDRCRCKEYAEAVKKLRFYTVGTHRPDIIDNYDRFGYTVVWKKHAVSHDDLKFFKPYALKVLEPKDLPENKLSKEARSVQKMWCPYMSPYKLRSD